MTALLVVAGIALTFYVGWLLFNLVKLFIEIGDNPFEERQ